MDRIERQRRYIELRQRCEQAARGLAQKDDQPDHDDECQHVPARGEIAKEDERARSASSAHSLRTGNEVASRVRVYGREFHSQTSAQAEPGRRATRFNVLGAMSFSHFLNDMMQSLIVAIYPLAQGRIPLEFRADRRDHAHLSGLRIALAARHRHLYRQASQALLAERRHGFHADRHADPGLCAELRQRARGRRTDRRGLRDLSSGILAHCAPRLGRPPRPGAVDFSSRRQCRQRHGSAARRLDHHSARPDQSGLVCPGGVARHRRAGPRRGWYKRQHLDRPAGSKSRAAAAGPVSPRTRRAGRSASWWC